MRVMVMVDVPDDLGEMTPEGMIFTALAEIAATEGASLTNEAGEVIGRWAVDDEPCEAAAPPRGAS